MKNSRSMVFSFHFLVFSILLYFGNRIAFLFLSEEFTSFELADRIMEAINQSFAEIAKFSPHIEFEQMSLLVGVVSGVSYVLFILYKTFDLKILDPMKNTEAHVGEKLGIFVHLLIKRKISISY